MLLKLNNNTNGRYFVVINKGDYMMIPIDHSISVIAKDKRDISPDIKIDMFSSSLYINVDDVEETKVVIEPIKD